MAVLSLLALAACKEEEEVCPASKMLVDGHCVPRTQIIRPSPETIPGECTPGETRCLDQAREATCLASGNQSTVRECGLNLACNAGACRPDCTPNVRLGCADPQSELWCNVDGMSTRTSSCPPGTLVCYDGQCQTSYACAPGTTICRGNERVECDRAGTSELVTPCLEICEDGECIDACASVDPENGYVGCDFWAVRLANYPDPEPPPFGVTLSNTTDYEARVELSLGRSAYPFKRVTVRANDVVQVPLTVEELPIASLDVDGALGLHIVSNVPLTVHQFNPINNVQVFSNDASLLLPANRGGLEFIVIGWPGVRQDFDLDSYLTIMAVEEGSTRVDVETPVRLVGPGGVGTFESGRSIYLRQGEVVSLTAEDPSGVAVTADKRISVFSGSICANVPTPRTDFCDHIEQQLIPTSGWGQEYVLGKFKPRGAEPDVFRVLAKEEGTVLTTQPPVLGLDGVTLQRGEFAEASHDGSFLLSATAPVEVAQFMVGSAIGCNFYSDPNCLIPRSQSCPRGPTGIGDPAFLTVIPVSAYLSEYVFLTPLDYVEDYVNVVAPEDSTVTLDGRVLTDAVPVWGPWVLYTQALTDGVHRISADRGIGLSVYGYDCDVSYAYPGGLRLR